MTALETAIEQSRKRLWAICYRMTGRASDADDLCQQAIVCAIERRAQVMQEDPTGWLIRIATTTCLDHLRRDVTRRRVTELADHLDMPGLKPGEIVDDPERRAILREDVRYALVVALQRVSPRQRAALILHDVCDRPLDEIAETLGANVNSTKALLHRARAAVARERHRDDVDVPVDRRLVEALAKAIEAGAVEAISALLAEDAWGIVDGGGVVPVATEPSMGRAAVMRRFANAWRRLDQVPLDAEVRELNGEPAVIVRVRADARIVVAVIHVETRGEAIAALRIDRDPRRTSAYARR
jgi:RNA polymerase sigma-70 factor, ECF subfamily